MCILKYTRITVDAFDIGFRRVTYNPFSNLYTLILRMPCIAQAITSQSYILYTTNITIRYMIHCRTYQHLKNPRCGQSRSGLNLYTAESSLHKIKNFAARVHS